MHQPGAKTVPGAAVLTVALLALAVLSAACKSGGSSPASPTAAASPQPSPTAAASPLTGTPTATPAREVCQPDVTRLQPTPRGNEKPSGRIMFVRLDGDDREVWVMNADGSDQQNVSNNPKPDDESDWSGDGKHIVFFSERDPGGPYLFVMDADGSNAHRITGDQTGHPGGDVSPKWSPDGRCIAFSDGGDLMVVNADGSNPQVVMASQPALEAEPCRAGSFVGGWSPDGQRLTYYAAVLRSGGSNSFWVCAVDYDGSNVEVLVDKPVDGLHAEPAWSPDGRYIAFRDDRDGNYDVWLLDMQTKEQINLTKNEAADIEPAWSPDGEWVVFGSMRDGSPNFDIYIIRRDGTDIRRLTDEAPKESYPAWTR